jgi:hypothetical protein
MPVRYEINGLCNSHDAKSITCDTNGAGVSTKF